VAVQSNVLTTELQSLASNAGAAVADLAGVVPGADVLASQFDALKNAMQDVADLASILRDSGFYTPVGSIVPFAGSAEPDGWYLCNGRAWGASGAPSTSSALFSVIGASFPAGLPNLSGKVIAGVGTMLGSARAVGAAVGAEQLPSHTHDGTYSGSSSVTGTLNGSSFIPDGQIKYRDMKLAVGSASITTNVLFKEDYSLGAWDNLSGSASVNGTLSGSASVSGTSGNATDGIDNTVPYTSASGYHGVVQPTIVLNYLIKG